MTLLCHYCEAGVTDGQEHECPFIGIGELKDRVVGAAVYALVGSGSITAHCRADAATLVFHWANTVGEDSYKRKRIDAMTEEAYKYFEFGDSHPEWGPEPQWAIWDDPSPSPSA